MKKILLLITLLLTNISYGALTKVDASLIKGVYVVYQSVAGTQTLTTASQPIVNYELKLYDSCTPNCVTTGASWVFTSPMDGAYLICASVGFTPNASGTRELYISINGGSLVFTTSLSGLPNAAYTQSLSGCTIAKLLKNGTANASVYQNSGGNLTLTANGTRNTISIMRVGEY